MKYLVTFSRDWADEFDVHGFAICTQEQVDEIKEWASTERSNWFGTNEGWEDEIFIDSYTFRGLTDEEVAVLERLFFADRRQPEFGFMPDLHQENR